LPTRHLRKDEHAKDEDEGNDAECRPPSLTRHQSAQPQKLGFSGNPEKANASHGGVPNVRQQSRPGKQTED
jgi:hypothetical protein